MPRSWIAVPIQVDLGPHLVGAGHYRIEVVDLKPQQHAIAVGPFIGITDTAMMMLRVECVQLQDQRPVRDETLIFPPTMSTRAAEKAPIPAAACLDVVHGDQWLGTHFAT
jgi:hypothetical protein